ncbi:MAG: hypothetical protein Kow0029_01520 [Candidatus Rifleibacteriota bacterium]
MSFYDGLKKRYAYYKELAGYPNAPTSAKIIMFVAVCYLVSPIDLIPDFIPIIGFLDDLVIVPILLWLAFSRIEKQKKEDFERQKSNDATGINTFEHCSTEKQ